MIQYPLDIHFSYTSQQGIQGYLYSKSLTVRLQGTEKKVDLN